jgi:hypothetical protein|nr:MAG TPA: ASCH domain protein [Herelleviridae sp.]DAJ81858.1 MAG TPA: ASCH domain protein [Caudoviricetes sp.]
MVIKPILFNTEMVQAIMDGRKSCTRRVVKPQWEECPHCKYVHNEYIYDEMAENVYCARCGYPLEPERRSPYQPEDILYVRETWHRYTKRVGKGEGCHLEEHYGYKASIANSEDAEEPWKPSIHMPKKAARIWLNVTNVRVERLQDMTDDDAEAEGCFDYTSTALGFPDVWDSTIKKSNLDSYGWDANPWVWVIEFERCEKPKEV